jgi:hypothetical protein
MHLVSPATGTAMQRAFDDAWGGVSTRYGKDPATIAEARMRLAECVNIVTLDNSSDIDDIRRMALQVLHVIER